MSKIDFIAAGICLIGGFFIGTQVDWALNSVVDRRVKQKEYAFEKSLDEIEANRVKQLEADVDAYLKRVCP